MLPDHALKPIEKLKVGDVVMAYDEKTNSLVSDKITQTFVHDGEEYLVINRHLRVTPNHPVLSRNQWVEAGTLKAGDTLTNAQGISEKIRDIKLVKGKAKIYNIEVNPVHTYVANGYIVHNKGPSSTQAPIH